MSNHLTTLVRRRVEASGIGKLGACHLFRHTMATLMLEGGADIRFIQEMLGYAALSTTQIYTQVSIRKVKEIHTATHPAARLQRHATIDDGAAELGDVVAAPNTAVDDAPDMQSANDAGDDVANPREELLSSLVAEAAEEEIEAERATAANRSR